MTREERAMRTDTGVVVQRRAEAGFTLIEALIAMVILIVGIAAIANLMVVAGTSNTVANSSTAASAVASQQMDLLKSASYETLVAGGTATVPTTPHTTAHPVCNVAAVTAGFACDAVVEGVGTIHVQWAVTGPLAGAAPAATYFIDVVAQPIAPATRQRGTARYTTFRTDNGA
jgi:type II secretory pathway pseudopilin PulG